MKNTFCILILFCIVSLETTMAQSPKKDTLNISVGIMVNPQGVVSFHPTEVQGAIPIFLFVPITKQKFLVAPFFEFVKNSVGVFAEYRSVLNIYLVATKNLKSSDVYSGIGISKNIPGNSSIFFETGTLINNPGPIFSLGASISCTWKVK